MRILITNDDGINAPGLAVLRTIAAEVAGPEGEVWTVAPASEQSGVGHCISFVHPVVIEKLGPRRFAAEGTPADCVMAALYDVMGDRKPDLVLSGVNRGNNAAQNVLYSGTVGGAMEAALQDLPAIALSQYYGTGNAQLENPFEATAVHGATVVRTLLDQGHWDHADYRIFYNVNFPPTPALDVKGHRVTAQGFRTGTGFGMVHCAASDGRRFLRITGGPQHQPSAPGTDAHANLDGYVSITPLRADLTAHDAIAGLKATLE
ncbi:MAG: 5'/3'-nucleotidase SurE [Rhodobacteraceae bacterium]|nr:5'/3'-nucleotidase SurE [Paracoccaceae bacterium]